jgi:hypothetical protein
MLVTGVLTFLELHDKCTVHPANFWCPPQQNKYKDNLRTEESPSADTPLFKEEGILHKAHCQRRHE